MTPSHRLVPVEATEEMLDDMGIPITEPKQWVHPETAIVAAIREAMAHHGIKSELMEDALWRATESILAAAPQPPAPVTDGREIVKELVEASGAMIEAQENDPAGHGRPENVGKQAATCDICQSIGRLAAAHAKAKDWLG